jgi:hypothetical protein
MSFIHNRMEGDSAIVKLVGGSSKVPFDCRVFSRNSRIDLLIGFEWVSTAYMSAQLRFFGFS